MTNTVKNVNNFQEIKKIIDFKEFYSQFDELDFKTSNNNTAWTCCPFHSETTASFQINYLTGNWHCFGSCQEGGDIFDFYQKYHNISRNKTLFEIAKDVNYEVILDEKMKEQSEARRKFFSFSAKLYKYFKKCLSEDRDCQEYLLSRGINTKAINKFGIGAYIPSKILSFINEDNLEQALDIGVVKYNDNNVLIPVNNSKRIMFPYIENKSVLTFTGRAINQEVLPKYLNFKNNSICEKGDLLYGVHTAFENGSRRAVFICEGQVDVIKAYCNGVTNIIALSGLKPTENQLRKLRKYGVKNFGLIIEDKAILTKNKRFSLESLKDIYSKIKVIFPFAEVKIIKTFDKDKCDLDNYFENNTLQDFISLENNSKIYNKFVIDTVINNARIKTIEDKSKYVAILKPHINAIKNTIERNQYITNIANKLEIPENDIFAVLNRYEKAKMVEIANDTPKVYSSRAELIKKTMPAMFLKNLNKSKLCETIKQYDFLQYFDEEHKEVFELFYKLFMQNISNDKIIELASATNIVNQAIVSEVIMRNSDLILYDDDLEEFIKDNYEHLNLIHRQGK